MRETKFSTINANVAIVVLTPNLPVMATSVLEWCFFLNATLRLAFSHTRLSSFLLLVLRALFTTYTSRQRKMTVKSLWWWIPKSTNFTPDASLQRRPRKSTNNNWKSCSTGSTKKWEALLFHRWIQQILLVITFNRLGGPVLFSVSGEMSNQTSTEQNKLWQLLHSRALPHKLMQLKSSFTRLTCHR